jgi:hypothetical protein
MAALVGYEPCVASTRASSQFRMGKVDFNAFATCPFVSVEG